MSNPTIYGCEAKKATIRLPLRSKRPRWGTNPDVILDINTFPVDAPIEAKTAHKVPLELWQEIADQSRVKTYRELAEEYNVPVDKVEYDNDMETNLLEEFGWQELAVEGLFDGDDDDYDEDDPDDYFPGPGSYDGWQDDWK